MAGMRSYTVLLRCHISAEDEQAVEASAVRGMELLMREDIIKAYEHPLIVSQPMVPVSDILDHMGLRQECACGGDADAPMHEQSLTHMAWVNRG